jgi:hypothetical protein
MVIIKLEQNKEYIRNTNTVIDTWTQLERNQAIQIAKDRECMIEVIDKYSAEVEQFTQLIEGNTLKMRENTAVTIESLINTEFGSKYVAFIISCEEDNGVKVKNTEDMIRAIRFCSKVQKEVERYGGKETLEMMLVRAKDGSPRLDIIQEVNNSYPTYYQEFREATGVEPQYQKLFNEETYTAMIRLNTNK